MSADTLMEALRKPFESSDLAWRAMFSKDGEQGPLILVAPYVNRPALINRLNQVCGSGGWQSDARVSGGRVYVGVGIRVVWTTDGKVVEQEWVWRWDGTGMLKAEGDHFTEASAGKGDFSNAFKRACELFGVALYLREIRPMKAIIDRQGRYKTKIGPKTYRWEPPGLEGTPSYPGEIPGFDREEGGEPSTDAAGPGDEPERIEPAKPKGLTPEQAAAAIDASKEKVRAFMTKQRLRVYHLDAVVLTHPDLKLRYSSAQQLGADGSLEDWLILERMTERNQLAWDQATRVLAEEFPTGPDRLQDLDRLMDLHKVNGEERVLIEAAKAIGWNDAIEYWIEDLGKR